VKPADLSQFCQLASRQLAKPADEGHHKSAWGLLLPLPLPVVVQSANLSRFTRFTRVYAPKLLQHDAQNQIFFLLPNRQNHTPTRKLNLSYSTAALSAGRVRHDNVTLTFELFDPET